ncbi:hypothetical protein CBW56_01885 [Denitratisoma oestradiolicum]|nr:hypothetical protein CBW56_01885 [Denitratisoma oestradiolicum]
MRGQHWIRKGLKMNEMGSAKNISRIVKSMARNRTYALLAIGFRYPEEDTFLRLADGSYAEEIAGALEVCAPELVDTFEEIIAPRLRVTTSGQELASAYLSAFETNMPDPSVSLYEGSYHQRGSKPALLLELKSFYRNFGLAIAKEENDLEDALSAELEFMQFLTAKQTQAEEGLLDKVPYLRAQRDFIERHLAAWLPALQADVTSKLKTPFYVALTELLTSFVSYEITGMQRDVTNLDR